MYGADLAEFNDIQLSAQSCFALMLGGGDFARMQTVTVHGTTVFYWSWIVIGLLVIMNLVIAVLEFGHERATDVIYGDKVSCKALPTITLAKNTAVLTHCDDCVCHTRSSTNLRRMFAYTTQGAADVRTLPVAVLDGLVDFLRGQRQLEQEQESESAGPQARKKAAVEMELAEIKHLVEELHHMNLGGEMSPHIKHKRRSRTSTES